VLSLTPEATSTMLVPAGDHYTMIDFATAYFRKAHVQDTCLPTASPMAEPPQLRLKARLCLAALMRFMGDQPKHKHQAEVQCIYEILQVCELPLGKVQKESELRGWLLLNLLTGYFLPSKILMPYATKFLQLASSDPSSTHHGNTLHVLVELRCAGRLQSQPLPQEGWMTLSLCHVGKMVRPIKLEEYLHDYLLEDKLVTVTLRRLIWRTPLHFDNQVYTDVHYGQVLWDYLNGRILLNQRNKEMEMQVGLLAMLQHWAKVEQQNSAPSSCQHYLLMQKILGILAALTTPGWCRKLLAESCCPQATFCCLLEHMMKLPFFGYSIFTVERISDDTIPVPCFFGVNKEEIIVWLFPVQAVSRVVPLKELQRMRTLRPISDGGPPGLELHYGSPESPRALWLELSQAKELYHTIVSLKGGEWPRKTALFPFL
uniref:Uncharacterized protein n=1 Tax=Geospiza parvula TaxID=87175 RepID=A0A8C3NQX7_GEOPR